MAIFTDVKFYLSKFTSVILCAMLKLNDSGLPWFISVACKDVDWTQSSKGVDRIESCKGMDRNGPRNSASHKDTDVSLHSPSIAWSM